MVRFTIYPYLLEEKNMRSNPYIHDFVFALNKQGNSIVINAPHKNPLLSILFPKKWGDVFIFNWFESIPDFKYGILQSITAIFFVTFLFICRKKIVWILHNKMPHASRYLKLKKYMMQIIAKKTTLIITHSSEGLDVVRENFPKEVNKTYYLDHPTKNRLSLLNILNPQKKKYDLLIWGNISKYKGIVEFVNYIAENHVLNLKICIVGNCSSKELYAKLRRQSTENVEIINKSLSFKELSEYIGKSEFVLSTYIPDTILSSGMLMDSLSFGAKVIGPDVGSFKDYSKETRLKVYTFKSFCDIEKIVFEHKDDKVSMKDYSDFLEENSWPKFADRLNSLLKFSVVKR